MFIFLNKHIACNVFVEEDDVFVEECVTCCMQSYMLYAKCYISNTIYTVCMYCMVSNLCRNLILHIAVEINSHILIPQKELLKRSR